MEKHWYLIVNDKFNEIRTTDRTEVDEALKKRNFKVTEVKEQTIYMESAVVRTTVYLDLKPVQKKGAE